MNSFLWIEMPWGHIAMNGRYETNLAMVTVIGVLVIGESIRALLPTVPFVVILFYGAVLGYFLVREVHWVLVQRILQQRESQREARRQRRLSTDEVESEP
jgi:hypothetical protein